jgi:hypothetical protein
MKNIQPVRSNNLLILSLVSVGWLIGGFALEHGSAAPATGLTWLRSLQDQTGLVQGSASLTDWSMVAVSALGVDPSSFGRPSLVQAIQAHPLTTPSATDLERRILALRAAGLSAERESSQLLELVSNGQFGSTALLNDDVFGVLALRAAGVGVTPVSEGATFIQQNQNADGGFSSLVGGASDVDSTGAALAALTVGGGDAIQIRRGFDYLATQQNADGGFGVRAGNGSNVDSTSWALWAYQTSDRTNSRAMAWLAAQERPDGSYGGALTTAYALIAQSGRSLPILGSFTAVQAPLAPPLISLSDQPATAPGVPTTSLSSARVNEASVSASAAGWSSVDMPSVGVSAGSVMTMIRSQPLPSLKASADTQSVRSDNQSTLLVPTERTSAAVFSLNRRRDQHVVASPSLPLPSEQAARLSGVIVNGKDAGVDGETGQIDRVAARTERTVAQANDRGLVRRLVLALGAIGLAELGLLSLGLGRWVASRHRSTAASPNSFDLFHN